MFGGGGNYNAAREAVAIEQRRRQMLENSSRQAQSALVHKTTGIGEIVTNQPIKFETEFIEEPRVTTGSVLTKSPDLALWRYPQISAGVYRWETKGNTDKTRTWIGAYLFFVISVDPRVIPRTDGSNLAAVNTQIAQMTTRRAQLQSILANLRQIGAPAQNIAQAELNVAQVVQQLANHAVLKKEAEAALRLKNNPPKVDITHHLTFTGTALKTLGDDAQRQLYETMKARTPGFGA